MALLLDPKSAILGLSFLDSKDLCLPNQFSRGDLQKRSVSAYLTWCQRRNWVASMIELTLNFNPSYVCHDMIIFMPESFVKFPWRYWAEFSQSWKDLRKILQSHENLQSLTNLSVANIGIHSNSRECLFWMFIMSKNQSINKKEHVVLERCVKSILYLHKYSRNAIPKCENIIALHVYRYKT